MYLIISHGFPRYTNIRRPLWSDALVSDRKYIVLTCCVHIYLRIPGMIFQVVSPFHFPFCRGKWYHRPDPGTPPAMAANDDYVFTRDLNRSVRVTEGLEFGMVALNTGVISDAAAP